jgi:TPR repeat protein
MLLGLAFVACAHGPASSGPVRASVAEGGSESPSAVPPELAGMPASAAAWRYFGAAVAGCKQGEPDACNRLFRRVLNGGYLEEVRCYATSLRAGCDRHHLSVACAGLGQLALAGAAPPTTAKQGLALLHDTCARGIAGACALEAESYLAGQGSEQDPGKGQRLLKEACKRVGGSPCLTLAKLELGDQPPSSGLRARLEHACATGSDQACLLAAMVHAEGEGGAADPKRAAALYEQACNHDLASACHNLAYQKVEGTTGPADRPAAIALFRKACTLGDSAGCDYMVEADEAKAEVGSAPDPKLAVAKKYCELGGAQACTLYAVALDHQDPGPANAEESIKAMTMGCNRGSLSACNQLGHLARSAPRACAAGRAQECAFAGFLYLEGCAIPPGTGPSITANPAKARHYLQQACDAGHKVICERIRTLK